MRSPRASRTARCPSPATQGFTLIELLVVIAILGILAGIAIPVLKNFGRSDATLGGSRQLLNDVAFARQKAISLRTTVYMVFIPTNFWIDSLGKNTVTTPSDWWKNLSLADQTAVTNLADKQLSGYTFIAYGAMGDQPGRHAWHYLQPWQSLPDGTFIAFQKFTPTTNTIVDGINPNKVFNVIGFNIKTNNAFPFPDETGTNNNSGVIVLPYIAFNYLGQLTVDGQTVAPLDEYIPLAHGSVLPVRDPNTKDPVLPYLTAALASSPAISENPPGNSTNSSYNIVHIDRLSGHAILEFQQTQ